jgi:hypothetical protein
VVTGRWSLVTGLCPALGATWEPGDGGMGRLAVALSGLLFHSHIGTRTVFGALWRSLNGFNVIAVLRGSRGQGHCQWASSTGTSAYGRYVNLQARVCEMRSPGKKNLFFFVATVMATVSDGDGDGNGDASVNRDTKARLPPYIDP